MKPETIEILQSPVTGQPLLLSEDGQALVDPSTGTGFNLRYLPDGVELHGLDISRGMLAVCRQNLATWGREAELSPRASPKPPPTPSWKAGSTA